MLTGKKKKAPLSGAYLRAQERKRKIAEEEAKEAAKAEMEERMSHMSFDNNPSPAPAESDEVLANPDGVPKSEDALAVEEMFATASTSAKSKPLPQQAGGDDGEVVEMGFSSPSSARSSTSKKTLKRGAVPMRRILQRQLPTDRTPTSDELRLEVTKAEYWELQKKFVDITAEEERRGLEAPDALQASLTACEGQIKHLDEISASAALHMGKMTMSENEVSVQLDEKIKLLNDELAAMEARTLAIHEEISAIEGVRAEVQLRFQRRKGDKNAPSGVDLQDIVHTAVYNQDVGSLFELVNNETLVGLIKEETDSIKEKREQQATKRREIKDQMDVISGHKESEELFAARRELEKCTETLVSVYGKIAQKEKSHRTSIFG